MAFLDQLLHLDYQLISLVNAYGWLVYALLFLIIFMQTGIVFLAIMPGDSLLFAIGALAAKGMLDLYLIIGLLIIAGISGSILNFWIGGKFGAWLLKQKGRWRLNHRHFEQTQAFYLKHGGKALIISCYIPIVRTFTSFIAGLAKMKPRKFILFNFLGITIWISSLVLLSYWFGNIPVVQRNFSLIVLAIILVSILPMVNLLFSSKK